jgi:hypothetical protein
LTKRETIFKKKSINAQRAIPFLPAIEDLKEINGDWETLCRKIYEILNEEYTHFDNNTVEKIKQLSIIKAAQESGRKSLVLSGSIKHGWVKWAMGYKKGMQINSNIQAARDILKIHQSITQHKLNDDDIEKLAKNLSKRISEEELKKKR